MKFVTYEDGCGRALPGVLTQDDTRILPLEPFAERTSVDLSSVQAVIEGGDASLAQVRRILAGANEETLPYESTRLLAPLPRPVQIRDVLCFLDHMRNAQRIGIELQGGDPSGYELPSAYSEVPLYYKANRMCVVGPEAEIERPPGCNLLDYELELGIVVGRQGKDIPREKARDHVFGYTIFNDVSARDFQAKEMPAGLGPAKGKDFDTGNVLGPCIVTLGRARSRRPHHDREAQWRGDLARQHEADGPQDRRRRLVHQPGRNDLPRRNLRFGHRAARLPAGAQAFPGRRRRGRARDRGNRGPAKPHRQDGWPRLA